MQPCTVPHVVRVYLVYLMSV